MIRTLSEKYVTRISICSGIFICLLLFVYSARNIFKEDASISDFANYYYGSLDFREGSQPEAAYDVSTFNKTSPAGTEKTFRDRHYMNYTPVPPFSLIFYLPFTFTSPQYSFLFWNLISSGLFLYCLIRLFRELRIKLFWLIPVLLAFTIPLKSNLQAGQGYLLVFALLSEGYIAWRRDRKLLTAALWSLALFLKIFPGIVVIFYLLRKDWKGLGYFVLCSILLAAITVALCGYEISRDYVFEILPRLSKGEINNSYARSYQSMQVLLKSLFVPDAMHNPGAIDKPGLYIILLGLFNLIILSMTLMLRRIPFEQFSALLFASLLISGYGTSYSLVLLIFPMLYVLSMDNKIASVVFLVLFAASVSIPVHVIAELPVPFSFYRLLLLLCTFFLFYYLYSEEFNWKIPALLCLPLAVVSWNGRIKSSESEYYFSEEKALLIKDFSVNDNNLHYIIRTEKGDEKRTEQLPFAVRSVRKSKRASAYPAREKNRVILNDSIELFLSDEKRGVGFYTIRKKLSDERQ